MRTTPQTQLVLKTLRSLGHATNREIFKAIKPELPGTTLQTVHRITLRLCEEGYAQVSSVHTDAMVLDANIEKHDHFVCLPCGKIKDITIGEAIYDSLQESIGTSLDHGSLTVHGVCRNCEKIT